MKKGLLVAAALLSMMLAGPSFAATNCDVWVGTWDVEYTDGSTAVWVVDNAEKGLIPSIVECKATGTRTFDSGDEAWFQIFIAGFFGDGFVYSEEENLGDSMLKHVIIPSEDGCTFDGTQTETQYGNFADYNILGGTSRSEECLAEEPEPEPEPGDNGTEPDPEPEPGDNGTEPDPEPEPEPQPEPEPEPEPEACIGVTLLGSDDPRLDTMRRFRDQILAESATGQTLIDFYYTNADTLIALCEKHPAAGNVAKKMLEVSVPVMKLLLGN